MLNSLVIAGVSAASLALCMAGPDEGAQEPAAKPSIYDFTVEDIDGDKVKLSKYKGDVLLIVNVASK